MKRKKFIIENFLTDYIKQQIEDDKKFIEKYKGVLLSRKLEKNSIKEAIDQAADTYALYADKNAKRNGGIHEILPNSKDDALKLINISYSIILSYCGMLGYTAISAIIGKTIMETFYLEERRKLISHSKGKTSESPLREPRGGRSPPL